MIYSTATVLATTDGSTIPSAPRKDPASTNASQRSPATSHANFLPLRDYYIGCALESARSNFPACYEAATSDRGLLRPDYSRSISLARELARREGRAMAAGAGRLYLQHTRQNSGTRKISGS